MPKQYFPLFPTFVTVMATYHHTSGINPKFKVSGRKQKPSEYFINGLNSGNRFILSECITLLESSHPEKRKVAETVLNTIPFQNDTTIRIGITGSPGVGKSTFIEAFGLYLISQQHRPAILAIDPSSQINKGSILGDKTRMQHLSAHPDAYVRPSPSGAVLGGTSAFTKEAIQVCEAGGFDIIIVETVGVGQSETEVDHITDVNILLLQPGAGDDIQGIKRGIVENADIFVINKADGTQLELAKHTKSAYKNAIQLFHHDVSEWICPVILTSALDKKGIDEVFQSITGYINLLKKKELFTSKRKHQELRWFERQSLVRLKEIAFENSVIKSTYQQLSHEMSAGKLSATSAIHQFEEAFRKLIHNLK
jgi:LAO/AO transport system kinase